MQKIERWCRQQMAAAAPGGDEVDNVWILKITLLGLVQGGWCPSKVQAGWCGYLDFLKICLDWE